MGLAFRADTGFRDCNTTNETSSNFRDNNTAQDEREVLLRFAMVAILGTATQAQTIRE